MSDEKLFSTNPTEAHPATSSRAGMTPLPQPLNNPGGVTRPIYLYPSSPQIGYSPNAYPEPPNTEYIRAAQKVNAKIKFFKHLTVFAISSLIGLFVTFLSLVGNGPIYGPFYVKLSPIYGILGWSIFIALHWWSAFGATEEIREQMIADELRRHQHS